MRASDYQLYRLKLANSPTCDTPDEESLVWALLTTQFSVAYDGFDFKTKFHKNPQLTTTYRQKAPIAQYVRRIEAQIAVRFRAMCLIYIMPKALGDILTVSILIGGCVFYSPSLPCVCRHFAILPQCNVGILAAKWRSKYRLELWATDAVSAELFILPSNTYVRPYTPDRLLISIHLVVQCTLL